jgi:urease accessory protein UreF
MAETEREPEREIVAGADAFGKALAMLLSGAELSVAVFSLGLNRQLYAREDVIDALRTFALRNERAQVRVLVADARAATTGGNPFLELARRLPSRIQMRELTPEKREADGPEIVIVDRRRMLELPQQKRLEAYHYPHAAPRVLEKVKEIDALWDESEPVLELSGLR